jgi:transcriptional regulator with XRE-family HTH domain
MDLGQKIQSLRRNKNMTQADLADALFVSRQSVQKWECSLTSPDISKLPDLAKLFNVSIETLLDPKVEEDALIKEAMTDKTVVIHESEQEPAQQVNYIQRRSILDYILLPILAILTFVWVFILIVGGGLLVLSLYTASVSSFAFFIWSIYEITINATQGTGAVLLSIGGIFLGAGAIFPFYRLASLLLPRYWNFTKHLIYQIKTFDYEGFIK